MTKNSILRAIAIPVAAIATVYGAVTFVGCTKDENPPPPPAEPFRGNVLLDSVIGPAMVAEYGAGRELGYRFLHNSSSPDGSKMFVVVNDSTGVMTGQNGTFHMFMLDLPALENGSVVKLAEGQIAGTLNTTVTYRSNWTANGTQILLSGGDRTYVINAADLTQVGNSPSVLPNDNHDSLPTADGKYAILALRTPSPRDGVIQLLRISDQTIVGNSVSVCNTCHNTRNTSASCTGCHPQPAQAITLPAAGATLCGLDGVVTRNNTAGTYSGTIYVAGHGGHLAKLAITIDDNGAEPVIGTPVPKGKSTGNHGADGANSLTELSVSTEKFVAGTGIPAGAVGTSTHKLHDARLDGNTIYWSTYTLDQNLKLHYGKIDVNGTQASIVDKVTDPDTAVSAPSTTTVDQGPFYCGSGQTATAFFPSTMTNKGYITVIPKADVQ